LAAELKPGDFPNSPWRTNPSCRRENWARRSDRIAAVPGRMNEFWFKVEREGVSYGQCSKLRGNDYSNMPIAFRGVSEESYAAWLARTRKKCAATDPAPGHFAANDAAAAERP
jgi:cytochrome c oxidase subunit 2